MTSESKASPSRLRLGRILRLTRKELRETLRDRRTVITLVLMPLLVYPLLSISFNKSLLLTAQQEQTTAFTIGVESESERVLLDELLVHGSQILAAHRAEAASRPESEGEVGEGEADGVEADGVEAEDDAAKLGVYPALELENQVASLELQLAVRISTRDPDPAGPRRFTPVQCELIYRENSTSSEQALRFVQDRLQAVNIASLRTRLARMGVPAGLPAEMTFKPVSVGRATPFSLATLVPLVLILMTITGAVYPAIDLTAGERERGTLETLIAAPISRMALLIAKYAAVLVVAILTALVNLLAMTVTLVTSRIGSQLFPDGLSPILMAQILGLMILFAAFFSAIVLALTSFARSFKEAQAYLIPVMLLAISPGLLSLMPGLELTLPLAVAPLVNIVLLSRDILEGNVVASTAVLAIASTAAYAIAAVGIASKIFGNDALLYASRGSWSELFQRPSAPTSAPAPAATVACLATLFPCYYVLANLAQSPGRELSNRLMINALVTVAVFGVWPVLFATAQRVRLRTGFRLEPAPWGSFLGAVLLGVSLWPFAHELFLLGRFAGLVGSDRQQFVAAEELLKELQGLPTRVLLYYLAFIPAVMEEFFFRGYLFQGLRQQISGPKIVLVTALLFGGFHILSPSTLTPERFLPSTFLGLVLGWVCYRCGSVIPGMLLHASHNGLLLLMVQKRDYLKAHGWNIEENAHLPILWLVTAASVTAIALLIVFWATRPGYDKKGGVYLGL